MSNRSTQSSPRHAAAVTHHVLGVWARALGCREDQVTDVLSRAGLPIEKLWNSIDAASSRD
ncbi:MAG: hypothetical protein ABIR52_05760 [Casimicrobiaceae bacterium]